MQKRGRILPESEGETGKKGCPVIQLKDLTQLTSKDSSKEVKI
jgi:hypothetical protein